MKFKELFDILLNEEDGLNGKDIRKINVYGSEGKNPHLHYYFPTVEGYIRLDKLRYFCHESHHEVWEKTYTVCLIFVNSCEDSSYFLNSGAFDCSVML